MNGAALVTGDIGNVVLDTAYQAFIGKRASGALTNRLYNGLIDELSLSSCALTPTEIQLIYDLGLNGMGKAAPTPGRSRPGTGAPSPPSSE